MLWTAADPRRAGLEACGSHRRMRAASRLCVCGGYPCAMCYVRTGSDKGNPTV